MDWISIIFWVIIAIRILMGFWKGGLKTLITLIVLVLAIGAAFLFCKPTGAWLATTSMHTSIYDAINEKLSSVVISSDAGISLGKEITMADLETAHSAWVEAGNTGTTQDMVKEIIHQGYSASYIPSAIFGTLDGLVIDALPETGTFTLAAVVAASLSDAACIAIGFCGILIVVFVVGMIVRFAVMMARKATGARPGMISRILGILVGAASAFVFCWTASIVIRTIGTSVPVVNEFLVNSMRLEDDSYWNIGKFFFNFPYGYADVLNWFLSLTNLQ